MIAWRDSLPDYFPTFSDLLDDLELRGQPDADLIKKTVQKVQDMPGAGDQSHVAAVFKLSSTPIPDTPEGVWDKAKTKTMNFDDLRATNAQLDRANLIWHVKHPGQSKMKAPHNTHPQIIKTNGDFLIVDGHHRLSALLLLGLTSEQCWVLKEKDM